MLRIAQLAPPFESVPPAATCRYQDAAHGDHAARPAGPIQLKRVYAEFTDVPLVSISDSQRLPVANANWLATVQHGIDLAQYTFNPLQGEYLAFWAGSRLRMASIARSALPDGPGLPLKIAARLPLPFKAHGNARADRAYYEQVVQPLLHGRDVELIGQVTGQQKDDSRATRRRSCFRPVGRSGSG